MDRFSYHTIISLVTVLIALNNSQAALINYPNKILFTSYLDGNAEIYSMKPDGSSLVRLTNNAAYDGQPSVSADTNKFVFVSDRAGNKEIYSMNTDGTSLNRKTYNNANDRDPTLAADGTKIVFVSDRDGNDEIYTMAYNGTGLTRLTFTSIPERYPAWSPDGTKIAYTAYNAVWVMNADGSNVTSLTNCSGIQTKPSWSPQGDKIAFSCEENGNSEIYALNLDGSGLTKLTDDPAFDQDPCWSPDGTKILFTSGRSGNNELYVMRTTDGAGVTNLSNNIVNDEEPCWGGLVSLSTPVPTPTLTPTPTVMPTPTSTPNNEIIYINFDVYPNGSPIDGSSPNGTRWPGTIITGQYASFGAIFSSQSGGPVATVGSGEASSLSNLLCGNPDSFQPIFVNIVNPATGSPWTAESIDVTLISVGDATYTAKAYASDLSTVLDSVSITNPGTGAGWCNKNSIKLMGPGIAKVTFEITKSYPGDGCGIDDLYIKFPVNVSTPSPTHTATPTPTATPTLTVTPTLMLTPTISSTPTATPTLTPMVTPTPTSGDNVMVTTIAGLAGQEGAIDGYGTAARFRYPVGITADNNGNLYIAEYHNHSIRKITPSGLAITIAGSSGQYGSSDGIGTAARFYYPTGITVDRSGNLYVADWCNHTIRKITPSGVVTTIAGSAGQYGSSDGIGTAARFYGPVAITIDGSDNLYVSDDYNHTIRKITPSGVVTTIAGLAGQYGSSDGIGTAARFYTPFGITTDKNDNLYVADWDNHNIRKITQSGVVTTIAGSAGQYGSSDGIGTTARFDHPCGITIDGSGNLYVTDLNNHTVRKITQSGVVTTIAGAAGQMGTVDGTGTAARFNSPAGITVDNGGKLYVTDEINHTIRKIAFQ